MNKFGNDELDKLYAKAVMLDIEKKNKEREYEAEYQLMVSNLSAFEFEQKFGIHADAVLASGGVRIGDLEFVPGDYTAIFDTSLEPFDEYRLPVAVKFSKWWEIYTQCPKCKQMAPCEVTFSDKESLGYALANLRIDPEHKCQIQETAPAPAKGGYPEKDEIEAHINAAYAEMQMDHVDVSNALIAIAKGLVGIMDELRAFRELYDAHLPF